MRAGFLPPPPRHLAGRRNVHLGEEVQFCMWSQDYECAFLPARVIEITADGVSLEVLVSGTHVIPEYLYVEMVAYSALPVTSTWRFVPDAA